MTREINCGTTEQWIRKRPSDTLSGLRSQGPFYYHNNRQRDRFSNLTQGVESLWRAYFGAPRIFVAAARNPTPRAAIAPQYLTYSNNSLHELLTCTTATS